MVMLKQIFFSEISESQNCMMDIEYWLINFMTRYVFNRNLILSVIMITLQKFNRSGMMQNVRLVLEKTGPDN